MKKKNAENQQNNPFFNAAAGMLGYISYLTFAIDIPLVIGELLGFCREYLGEVDRDLTSSC